MYIKQQPYFKRMLAIVLSVVMLFSQLPMSVFAVEASQGETTTPVDVVSPEAPEEETTPTGGLSLGQSVTVEAKTLVPFTPEVSGVYGFYSTKSSSRTDPWARLLDADKKFLAENDDGADDLNFELWYELTAGTTYYLEANVHNDNFPYELWVKASDISSIELISIPTFEVEEYSAEYGTWSDFYNNEIVEPYFEYVPYPALRQVLIKVNYKDETSKIVGGENGVEGLGFEWDFYNNPWTVGTDNHYYVTYKGFKVLANATLTASPVKSIEILNIDIPAVVEHDENCGNWITNYQGLELEEKLFFYNLSPHQMNIKLLVTYEDDTTAEVSYRDADGARTGIMLFSNQYQTPWTVGSDNEFEIWYRGAHITQKVTVEKSPVKSIEVIRGGTHEYTPFDQYCGDWINEGEGTFYYYPENFMSDVVLKVTYTDDTSEEIAANRENGVCWFDNQYDEPWMPGSENDLRISYKGVSTTVKVKVKPSIVKSISVGNVTVTEGTSGSYYPYETPEGTSGYYYYYHVNPQNITVELIDGTTITGDQEKLWQQLGSSIFITSEEEQYYENSWGVGEYTMTASLLGVKTEFLFKIVESNIASITVANMEVEQNNCGEWNEGYWDPEIGERLDVEWYEYYPSYQAQITVTFNDGTPTYTGPLNEFGHIYGAYPQVYTDQTYYNQWQLDQTYTAKVYLCGEEAEFSVTVVEPNVKKIEVIDTRGFTYYENDTSCGEWRGDVFYYNAWELANRVTIRVTYKDGTTENISWTDENGMHTGISYDDNQHETPWTVGGENPVTITYGGAKTTISAVVEASPVKSIVVDDITHSLNTGGHWNDGGHWDEYGNWVEGESYYYYNVMPENVTITFADDNVISGTREEIYQQTGVYFQWSANQDWQNPWGVGSHTATITFMGKSAEYNIIIEESNVAGITIDNMIFMEGTGGYYNRYSNSEGEMVYWYYYPCTPDTVTITYKDGDSITGTFEEIYQQTGYYPELNTSQNMENPWGVGTHTATISFMGATDTFDVTITPTNVKSISVENITHYELSGGWWNEYFDETGRHEYYHYSVYLNQVTITYEDDTVLTGTMDEISERTGYNVSMLYEQNHYNQWGVGAHTVTVAFGGITSEMTVNIEVSPIKSIVVDTVYLEEGTHGDWGYYMDWGYRFTYSPVPQNITIIYSDDTVLQGSYDELYEQLNGEISYGTFDQVGSPWGVGTHKANFSYMGTTVEYDVVITPSRIESVTVEPLIRVADGDGWITGGYDDPQQGWIEVEWYRYDNTPEILHIIFTDGTQTYVTYEDFYEMGYGTRLVHDQSPSNVWQTGIHPVTMIGMGFQTTYNVEIVERIETEEFAYAVLSDGTVALMGISGYSDEVTIPETIDGYTVRVLHRYLYQSSGVKSLTIPATVQVVGQGAFAWSNSLETVRIYAKDLVVAREAFAGCENLENVIFFGTEEEAEGVAILAGNDYLKNAQWHYIAECAEHEYDDVCDADCNVCFATREPVHAYEWVVDYAGDCLNNGNKHEECSLCQTSRNWNTEIPADGTHDNTELMDVVEATCYSQGYTGDLYCYDCGNYIHYGEWTGYSTNHRNTQVHNEKPASCGKWGYSGDVYCCDCGNYVERGHDIEPTGQHEHTDFINVQNATCYQTGYTGDYYCFDCESILSSGETIPAKNHQNAEIVGAYDATCGQMGYTGDLFCNDCNKVVEYGREIEPTNEHANTERRDQVEATCDQMGYTGDLHCIDCGTMIEFGEDIPRKEHVNTELRGKQEATCGQMGYTGDLYCNDCGKMIEQGEEVLAKEHENTELRGKQEATCGQPGYTGDLYCNDCGRMIELGEEVLAKEHENTELRGKQEATCGQPGYTGDLYCNDCQTVVKTGEETPATGSHGALTLINYVAATCNQAGYTGDVFCKICQNVVESGDQILATGKHVYDNGYDVDCNECGEVREITLEPAKLTMNGGTTYQGQTIRVDVSIENNTGFAGLQFGVLFDSTYLTLKAVETEMEGFYVTVGNSIVFDAIENYTVDGVIATLVFEVAEDAPVGEYSVLLRFMSGSTEDFEAVVMTGSATTITVESAVAGDANGDGKVDTIDVVMIRKYLAFMDPITKVSEIQVKKGADYNNDGVIDAIDLAYVRQQVADMTVS